MGESAFVGQSKILTREAATTGGVSTDEKVWENLERNADLYYVFFFNQDGGRYLRSTQDRRIKKSFFFFCFFKRRFDSIFNALFIK